MFTLVVCLHLIACLHLLFVYIFDYNSLHVIVVCLYVPTVSLFVLSLFTFHCHLLTCPTAYMLSLCTTLSLLYLVYLGSSVLINAVYKCITSICSHDACLHDACLHDVCLHDVCLLLFRSYPSRPQSAGGSTQKPFLMGNIRNRSNSACRPVIQRGENFSIVMPTENENEAEEVLNLEESFDGEVVVVVVYWCRMFCLLMVCGVYHCFCTCVYS